MGGASTWRTEAGYNNNERGDDLDLHKTLTLLPVDVLESQQTCLVYLCVRVYGSDLWAVCLSVGGVDLLQP